MTTEDELGADRRVLGPSREISGRIGVLWRRTLHTFAA